MQVLAAAQHNDWNASAYVQTLTSTDDQAHNNQEYTINNSKNNLMLLEKKHTTADLNPQATTVKLFPPTSLCHGAV